MCLWGGGGGGREGGREGGRGEGGGGYEFDPQPNKHKLL